MGRRNKLQKFADILSFTNVYENVKQDDPQNKLLQKGPSDLREMAGCWASDHFDNDKPIILELACGRGEYSIALARDYDQYNYIGVDVKGARIWQGSRIATKDGLDHVAFLRTRIEVISSFFAPEEVSEIWITFPDPFLRESKSDRRLTSHPFLERYRQIIKPGGILHLKTDDPTLYEFSMETLTESELLEVIYHKDDIYSSKLDYPVLAYKTYYEQMHLKKQKSIKYIRSRYLD